MSKQFSVKYDPNFAKRVEKKMEKFVEDELENLLINMASDATRWSPIYSGAYVQSFSFQSNTSTRGRRRQSRKEGGGSEADRQAGFNNLVGDISKVLNTTSIVDLKTITLRNDAPHAQVVERGAQNMKGPGPNNSWPVFAKLKDKYR
jgi:hypothetical protein